MNDQELRNQLIRMLTIRQAHMDFTDAVAKFPPTAINSKLPNCNYSFWHLLEHLRLAQQDILEYILSDNYQLPIFPDGYWPDLSQETDLTGWQQTIDQLLADRQQLVALINNPETDLFAPLANSKEQQHSLLREINIIANHNAYHTGELGLARQIMNLWPPDEPHGI